MLTSGKIRAKGKIAIHPVSLHVNNIKMQTPIVDRFITENPLKIRSLVNSNAFLEVCLCRKPNKKIATAINIIYIPLCKVW